jgi:hypothetical protein
MKKFRVLFVLAMFGAILMCIGGGQAYAYTYEMDDYSGYWVATDGDGQTIEFKNSMGDNGITEFGIYYGDVDTNSQALLKTGDDPTTEFSITGTTLSTQYGDVALDSTKTYGFYYVQNGVKKVTYDVGWYNLNTNTYYLTLGDSVVMLSVDSKPVPIPPSALLLGSGMIGLIGFGVRRRKYRVS